MSDEKQHSDRWDAVAMQFNDLRVPEWSEDLFLKTILPLPVWGEDSRVLDLGCGAGRYSVALSKRCGQVIGSDASAAMIRFAEKKKEEFGRDNISFVTENWHEADIDERGYRSAFDLVIGHMTPALDTPEDVLKATQASRGYCALATFAERVAPMNERFYDFLGEEPGWKDDKSKIKAIFSCLHEEGLFPQVSYYLRDDTQVFSESDAVRFLADRYALDGSNVVDEEVSEKIREFVKKNLTDDEFVNEVQATIVTIVWGAEGSKQKALMPGYVR